MLPPSMVVADFDVVRITIYKAKTDAPVIIYLSFPRSTVGMHRETNLS